MIKAQLKFAYGVYKQPEKNENLLYYYCSMNTFTSIIKSKTIWLRNLLSMNDPNELFLCNVNIAQQLFLRYKKRPFEFTYAGKQNEEAMQIYLQPASFIFSSGSNGINSNLFFAVCMSEKEDSLSQWRMYADNGKGVCLGFDKSKIISYTKNNPDDYQLQKIEYYENIESVIDKVCEIIFEKIREIYNTKNEGQLLKFISDVYTYTMPEWSKYKTIDYSDEKETRLVYKKHAQSVFMNIDASKIEHEFLLDLDWALLNDNLDLHTQLNISDLGLSTITLGPLNNTSKGILNILLAKEVVEINHDKIFKSIIPYRGES